MSLSVSASWTDVPPKSQRSARIKDQDWNQYQPLLTQLYSSYTLLEVMDYMKQRYHFAPSKRQYGYRFEKWHVKKYNCGEKKTPMRPVTEMDKFVEENASKIGNLGRIPTMDGSHKTNENGMALSPLPPPPSPTPGATPKREPS
ncbi:hypothetical protein G7046_g9951 [Stylonectria norvegica]|nr:hypothetical protein G7046_g9951 [Stylonectria norvegica]